MRFFIFRPFSFKSASELPKLTGEEKQAFPKDWPFMEQSGEVLADIPQTWRAYPDNEAGRMNIVTMEYNELMKAQTPVDKMHELVHLASACLHLWRLYHDTVEPTEPAESR